jgi:putative phage-type endonuclease
MVMGDASTVEMTIDEWRSRRLGSIGSSDAPVICNVDPWRTPLELYYIKTGKLEEPELTSNAVQWGIRLEDIVARAFAEKHGLKVRKDNKIRVHRHHYWQTCNLDRVISRVKNRKGPGILEVKCTRMSEGWGASGTDEVPDRVMIQVQHQLAVTGFKWAYVAALIGGSDERWYEIPPDKGLIDTITNLEKTFWDHVINESPPAPDMEHPSTETLLRRLYPGSNGEVIYFSDEAVRLHEKFKEASTLEKQYRDQARTLKAALMYAIGEAAIAYLPDGTAWTRKEVDRKAYSVKACKYVDVRHVKNPKV